MQLVYDLEEYRANRQKLVLALGNFDGLHLAHRKIIKRTKNIADSKSLLSAVLLLDPHPFKILFPHKNLLLLSTLEKRIEILNDWGLDILFIQKFTSDLAGFAPLQFVQRYLVNILQVDTVIIGFDYTFGSQGKGTASDLLHWGKTFGFNVEIVPSIKHDNKVVSSTLIRNLLRKGEVKKASDYLGFCFTRSGKVIQGEGRGRQLGFPTANLDIPGDLLLPAHGVYLSLVYWRGREMFGLTNIGVKPTFATIKKTVVEVYLLDFDKNIYGEELSIKFLCKIRNEVAFKDANSLKKQIALDINCARDLIGNKYEGLKKKQLI